MVSENASPLLKRKQNTILALCKGRSLDPKPFLDDADKDLNTLCSRILVNNSEISKWIEFAEKFPLDSEACFRSLNELNEDLVTKSVIDGGGSTPSATDLVVFSTVHPFVFGLSNSKRVKFPHVLRWMDYIQNRHDIGELFESVAVEKPEFDPTPQKTAEAVETGLDAKKAAQSTKEANIPVAESNTQKKSDMKKVKGDKQTAVEKEKQTAVEKKKVPEKGGEDKDKDVSVSLLKIQVGLIRKAWKHPSADSLLVEEIDIGDPKCRQVVSGLAKYISPEELTNRRVVLITNVKPGKLRDVMSEGLVLCASNEDHSIVEPLFAPEGASIGECVSFSGHEGKPEDVLNPKKKQFDKIAPFLSTDDKGVAAFKGIPFMTSGGPCTSSLPNANIR